MKRTLSIVLLLVAAAFSSVMFAGTRIDSSQLPEAARTFLDKHFPGDRISKAEKDRSISGTEYEVDLASGAEIEFYADGSWKDVKAARAGAVPSGIVPDAITRYVATNYPSQSIVEISHERGGFEVELTSDIELHLTADGTPMTRR